MIGAAINVACANGTTMLVVAGSIEQTMQAIIELISEENHDRAAWSTVPTSPCDRFIASSEAE
jgi:S-adenosylhomocysteine hydrolase